MQALNRAKYPLFQFWHSTSQPF